MIEREPDPHKHAHYWYTDDTLTRIFDVPECLDLVTAWRCSPDGHIGIFLEGDDGDMFVKLPLNIAQTLYNELGEALYRRTSEKET